MKILKGKTVSSGIAKGVVTLYSSEYEESVPHYGIDEAQVPNEKERLKEAFEKTKSLMSEMITLAKQSSEEQAAKIVNVHLMILNDPNLILKLEQLIIQNKINAEHAIFDVFNDYNEWPKAAHGGVRQSLYPFH
jgi:phosphotransferase system enzyme I (PtsI)